MDDLAIIINAKETEIKELTSKLQASEARAAAAEERQKAFELKLVLKEQQISDLQDLTKDLMRRETPAFQHIQRSFLDPLINTELKLLKRQVKDLSDKASVANPTNAAVQDKNDTKRDLAKDEEIQTLKRQLDWKSLAVEQAKRQHIDAKAYIQQLESKNNNLAIEVAYLKSHASSLDENGIGRNGSDSGAQEIIGK